MSDNFWIIIPITIAAFIIPAQLLTIMHALYRTKSAQENLTWIMIIFMLGILGIIAYFIMPISRRPRIREDLFDS